MCSLYAGGNDMPLASAELKAELTARLRRIEGQVRGVQRMLDEDRECPEVLQQLAAIRSAVHQSSLLLTRAYLARAFGEALSEARSEAYDHPTHAGVASDSHEELFDRLMATLAKLD
jgi:CsoR family transcriptional regulator, copper-sensing transcriptional repressor